MVDSLTHYGVLGMKWGVRKDRKSRGSKKRAKSSKVTTKSEDYKKTETQRKKKASELSDKELKETIERMRLEQQYKDLQAKNVSAGEKFAKEILREVAKETVKSIARETIREYVWSGSSSKQKSAVSIAESIAKERKKKPKYIDV